MTTSPAKPLKCVHCDSPLTEENISNFQKVVICQSCYLIASRLLDKIHKELEMLKNLATENIRLALIEKRLLLQAQSRGEPTTRQVLQEVLNLQKVQESKREHSGGQR